MVPCRIFYIRVLSALHKYGMSFFDSISVLPNLASVGNRDPFQHLQEDFRGTSEMVVKKFNGEWRTSTNFILVLVAFIS